jgi:hypothetical protein
LGCCTGGRGGSFLGSEGSGGSAIEAAAIGAKVFPHLGHFTF